MKSPCCFIVVFANLLLIAGYSIDAPARESADVDQALVLSPSCPAIMPKQNSRVISRTADIIFMPLNVCIEPEDEPEQPGVAPEQGGCWSRFDETSSTSQYGMSNDEVIAFRQQQGLAALFLGGFLLIRMISGDRNLPSMANAMVTGPAGIYIYFALNQTISEILQAPATVDFSLANTAPLVLYGYGGFELLDSLAMKDWTYVVHGSVIFVGCTAVHYTGKMQIVVYGMIMEVSQIFFNAGVLHKKYHQLDKPSLKLFGPFVVVFFISRWGVFPYEYARFIWHIYLDESQYQNNPGLNHVIAAVGAVINALNLMFGITIIRKAKKVLR